MIILAVDTATRSCSVAICQNSELLAEITLIRRQTHSRHLLEMIHQAIDMAGLALEQIDGFAVTRGPGSFTGLRIGLSCIKGLAFAAAKPVVSVSSLEALASQAFFHSEKQSLLVCPVLDARKKEIYFTGYRSSNGFLARIKPEMVLPPHMLSVYVDPPCMFIGEGAVLYKDVLVRQFKSGAFFVPAQHNIIRAHSVALLSLERFRKKDHDDLSCLVPEYIRKSDAEFKLSSRNKKFP